MRQIVVVNNPKNWPLDIPGVEVIAAKDYISDSVYTTIGSTTIYNLCRSYRYQSLGYYVSLLAAARGHKSFPDVLTIQDLKSQAIIRIVSEDLDKLIQKSLKSIVSSSFTLSVYFGKNVAKRYDMLSHHLFSHFSAPLLRAEFVKKESTWLLRQVHPIATSDIPEEHKPFIRQAAEEFFKKRYKPARNSEHRYDLAILVNPDEELPPSDKRAIQRFLRIADDFGFYSELITKEDYSRLNEFDALFIRETTSVNHHTYRMARRAEKEGLIVIDDPNSILLCTNKVYLAELLKKHHVPAPKTLILNSAQPEIIEENLGFPCIIKQPDSSFSLGVSKVDNADEFVDKAGRLLEKSELLIAQQFIPTPFDWRIGILNGKPLYACKYFMARKHWQIYERSADGKTHEGDTETLDVNNVPKPIIKAALKAANLIGNGLYGVDLKEIDGNVYVIEVNDNPSIDYGVEDAVLKDDLYKIILGEFVKRIEQVRG